MKYLCCLITILVLVPLSEATSFRALSLHELAAKSHLIVKGSAISNRCQMQNGHIWTAWLVEIEEYIKGSGSNQIEVWQPGGMLGDFQTNSSGTRTYILNQACVFFLWRDSKGQFQPMGFAQGSFQLVKNFDGLYYVNPDSINYSLSNPGVSKSISSVSEGSAKDQILVQFLARGRYLDLKKWLRFYE